MPNVDYVRDAQGSLGCLIIGRLGGMSNETLVERIERYDQKKLIDQSEESNRVANMGFFGKMFHYINKLVASFTHNPWPDYEIFKSKGILEKRGYRNYGIYNPVWLERNSLVWVENEGYVSSK